MRTDRRDKPIRATAARVPHGRLRAGIHDEVGSQSLAAHREATRGAPRSRTCRRDRPGPRQALTFPPTGADAGDMNTNEDSQVPGRPLPPRTRASAWTLARRPQRTTNERWSPPSSDACFVMAKEASALGVLERPGLVQGERVSVGGRDACFRLDASVSRSLARRLRWTTPRCAARRAADARIPRREAGVSPAGGPCGRPSSQAGGGGGRLETLVACGSRELYAA